MTPFQCFLGSQPPLFRWTGELSEVPSEDCWFRESKRVWDAAHMHLQWAVWRHKDYADTRCSSTPRYQPGISFLLSCWRQMSRVDSAVWLSMCTFHVSMLKPFVNPLLPPSTEPEIPPPPEVNSSETIYQVREILDSRRRGGRLQYLVD